MKLLSRKREPIEEMVRFVETGGQCVAANHRDPIRRTVQISGHTTCEFRGEVEWKNWEFHFGPGSASR